eukprot:753650-Hanusia_phi.AAC.4
MRTVRIFGTKTRWTIETPAKTTWLMVDCTADVRSSYRSLVNSMINACHVACSSDGRCVRLSRWSNR